MRVESKGVKIKNGVKVHSPQKEQKERIQSYLDADTAKKLDRLSRSCKTTKHKLAADMIKYLVNHRDFVIWIQDRYGVPRDDLFRLNPKVEDGKLNY